MNFKILFILSFLATSVLQGNCRKREKPNILWLVVEDTSPYLFPAYGNQLIKTPNLDFLAENGLVFNNAFANGPQCSPARSSLISGRDATTFGNDIHREGRPVPVNYFFPPLLREQGYFCANQGKTDYNIPGKEELELLKKVWDRNGNMATYNDSARKDQPFFAMFNDNCTHMSRMTTVTLDVRKPCRITVSSDDLPPYVPDLPETRADYALHLEGIEDCDKWVGLFLDDLRKRNLLENTIIFFFSDNGGCLPRGKAFPFDTGFRVAFIAYVPEKWQHLWDEKPGSRSERLVTFTDFGPTVLSLAGIRPPEYMQGVPFMGEFREQPKKYAYTFRANTGNHFDPSRTVYDGRFHYIRFYTPYKIHGLRQAFQWGMPAQLAWDKQFHSGKSKPEHMQYYQSKPSEMLFDLENDPWEMDNLVGNPKYKDKLIELRTECSKHMYEIKDLGFFPQNMRVNMVKDGGNLHDNIKEKEYPLTELLQLVELSCNIEEMDGKKLAGYLGHSEPAFRFWAVSGFVNLYHLGLEIPVSEKLLELINDRDPAVSATAAEALVYAEKEKQGIDALIEMCSKGNGAAASALEEILHYFEADAGHVQKLKTIYEKNYDENEGGVSIRSILINLGELPMDGLHTQEAKDNFLKGYHQRISTWAPTRPN